MWAYARFKEARNKTTKRKGKEKQKSNGEWGRIGKTAETEGAGGGEERHVQTSQVCIANYAVIGFIGANAGEKKTQRSPSCCCCRPISPCCPTRSTMSARIHMCVSAYMYGCEHNICPCLRNHAKRTLCLHTYPGGRGWWFSLHPRPPPPCWVMHASTARTVIIKFCFWGSHDHIFLQVAQPHCVAGGQKKREQRREEETQRGVVLDMRIEMGTHLPLTHVQPLCALPRMTPAERYKSYIHTVHMTQASAYTIFCTSLPPPSLCRWK